MRIEEIPETTFRASHDSGGTLIICSGRHKITLAPEEWINGAWITATISPGRRTEP